MEIVGKIELINDEQQVSSSFRKRELVIATDEQYVQYILIEFNQDKCDILEKYKKGDAVKVSINLRGRSWINPQGEMRYFNSIQGWRIEAVSASATQMPVMPAAEAFAPATNYNDDESGDLPF